MRHFAYRNGVMRCEDVSLEAIARELDMPSRTIPTLRETPLALSNRSMSLAVLTGVHTTPPFA
jgi:hypothetical protein